jgi:hypothetical protein
VISLRMTTRPAIFKIVLTGGPCAGKTTATARITGYLRERGFRVFTVPEAATMLFSNGASFDDLNSQEGEMQFQVQLLKTQESLEGTFSQLAQLYPVQCVIICDRGAKDGSAYISPEQWSSLLNIMGTTDIELIERYDAVFHLVTAADGAEKFYTLANNQTRTEDLESARQVDLRLREAWKGHPNHFVFYNESTFEHKLKAVIRTLNSLVELPQMKKSFRKFLLKSVPDLDKHPHTTCNIEKVYLVVTDGGIQGAHPGYSFIRRREQNGLHSYALTQVINYDDGSTTEMKRMITGRDFRTAKATQSDKNRRIIRQKRITLIFEDIYCEINYYIGDDDNIWVREGVPLILANVQGTKDASPEHLESSIQHILDINKEVTADPNFSAYSLSIVKEAEL